MNRDMMPEPMEQSLLQPTLEHLDRAIENIKQHIAECDERIALRKDDQMLEDFPNSDFAIINEREQAFRNGLQRALDHLAIE